MASNDLTKALPQVFAFLSHLYRGNLEYRWQKVPFIPQQPQLKKSRHQSAAQEIIQLTHWHLSEIMAHGIHISDHHFFK